jgi:hypothetical protein
LFSSDNLSGFHVFLLLASAFNGYDLHLKISRHRRHRHKCFMTKFHLIWSMRMHGLRSSGCRQFPSAHKFAQAFPLNWIWVTIDSTCCCLFSKDACLSLKCVLIFGVLHLIIWRTYHVSSFWTKHLTLIEVNGIVGRICKSFGLSRITWLRVRSHKIFLTQNRFYKEGKLAFIN